jgi:UDP-3-O-[3-hydroxymyristoyl] glucosamine N-acyltransferase
VTLRELADRLGCRLDGDGSIEIRRVAGLEAARPGDLAFFANARYAAALRDTRASAVIAADGIGAPCAVLRSSQPYLTFAQALELFTADHGIPPGVHATAAIGRDVTIGADACIGAFVSIGDGARLGDRVVVHPHVAIGGHVTIGDDCILYPHVSIRERCAIGSRVILQDGAVVGSDGFGFVTLPDGSHHKVPQRATVVIEDDVEIGANTTIDRPAVGETRVLAGARIDNLVQIAHSVRVGHHALLAAQVGIAGSTTIGDHVVLAGQVGVAGHLTIGDRVIATAQTGIPNSVTAGSFVSGYPAIDNREWLKSSAVFRRLPELRKQLADLASRLEALEARLRNEPETDGGTST